MYSARSGPRVDGTEPSWAPYTGMAPRAGVPAMAVNRHIRRAARDGDPKWRVTMPWPASPADGTLVPGACGPARDLLRHV